MTLFSLSTDIKITLESATLQVNNWLPLKKPEVKVVPDNCTLKTELASTWYWHLITELYNASVIIFSSYSATDS